MKQILVATDFSERSNRAVLRAAQIAKRLELSLTILHVVDNDQPQQMIDIARATALQLLSECAGSLRKTRGLTCNTEVVIEDPFEGILKASAADGVGLIVIGAHRRQLLKDVFLGTTAERTIRSTRLPVLMVNSPPIVPYRHILLAVDLSEPSAAAARALKTLEFSRFAPITALHVFDAPAAGLMMRTSASREQLRKYFSQERRRAAVQLKEFTTNLDIKTDKRVLKLGDGSVAVSIEAVAREISADLLVVGTHGRSGFSKLLLGSVTEQLLRGSDRDVLAVPGNPQK